MLKESPAVLSLGILCEENGFSNDEWHPGQPSYLTKNGRTSNVKQTTTHPWLFQACQHLVTRPVLWVNGSRHELWATTGDVWKQNHQNGSQPFTEALAKDRQVRQTSLQVTWRCHRQHFLLPLILQQHRLRTEQEESTIYSLIFGKTRIAKSADSRKLRERHAEEILTIGRTEFNIAERLSDMIKTDHKILAEEQESRLHHKLCTGCARLGDLIDSKLSLQNQITPGDAVKSQTFLTFGRKPMGQLSGIY